MRPLVNGSLLRTRCASAAPFQALKHQATADAMRLLEREIEVAKNLAEPERTARSAEIACELNNACTMNSKVEERV